MDQKTPLLSLRHVVKKYHNHIAVNDVSFDVEQGTIFGLLGPNGAGKTSIIRIITRITAADSGEIFLNGEKLQDHHPSQIGYMPEERGLYKKMKVGEQLIYLAQLKGLSYRDARQKLLAWMKKFDITSWWDKKISDLSKGMQQKVQFIATVVHEPSLIILDEPFSGLDPINANLIKDEIFNLACPASPVHYQRDPVQTIKLLFGQDGSKLQEIIARVGRKLNKILQEKGYTEEQLWSQAKEMHDKLLNKLKGIPGIPDIEKLSQIFVSEMSKSTPDNTDKTELDKYQEFMKNLTSDLNENFNQISPDDLDNLQKMSKVN